VTPRSPGAFLLSTTFHLLVIGGVCLFTLDSCERRDERPKILELVAGEGDNFGATEAPALGTPNGLKVDVPAIPLRQPDPEPPAPQPTPPPPEPKTVTPPPEPPSPPTPPPTPTPPKPAPVAKKAPDAAPNFKKQILRKVWAADAKAKKDIAKERAEEQKRLKKEEADRQQREKAKIASAKGTAGSVPRIDAAGIAKGVVGGSSSNKTGGAGGKALTRDEGAIVDAYYALLVQKVKGALDKPPGVSDELSVTVVFHISASGAISSVRVSHSSGSEEWDRAVVRAFSRVRMPDHPLKHGEDAELEFRTKDAGQG
jgi:colicin import membrane protein